MAEISQGSRPPDCSKERLDNTGKGGGNTDTMVIMSSKRNCSNPVRVGLYEICEVIGEGNFATVRKAKHRHTNSDVAIKIIDKTKLSAADLEKVNREIQIMKLLNHPNIIKLYQVMETKEMLYLVTEYAPNGEIFDHIVKNGNLTEVDARRKFWQILSAIEYCHNHRVVHRDLKAENLLIDVNGNIKICDFGFGRQFPEDGYLATFCGSPPYAAPELFEGHTYKGPEVDIWSLGVVLYVLVCGGLPFYGVNLRDLRDRVVKGMFRIPYWMSQDCEHLIRHMLVKDPEKRYTIEQIKRHKWLIADGEPRPIHGYPRAAFDVNSAEEYSEQVLRLMEQLGLERNKTIEQLKKNDVYDHYTAIYHLLLDRMRLHRSSYPLDKQISSRQNRRPSTVAENALSHPKYQQHLLAVHQQQQLQHQQSHQHPAQASTHIPVSYAYASSCTSDYSINSVPMSSHTSINNTYSTSAESGLEVDMDTGMEVAQAPPKPPLARRHTLTGMTGIPGTAENMLRNIGGPSVDSGHGMELNSESQSIDSNLDSSEHYTSPNTTHHAYNVYPPGLSHVDNSAMGAVPGYSRPNDSQNVYAYNGNGRRKTKSPINFREGRRASDGLVCQDVIAFRQRLKDGMKAGGMLELRHEHNKLLESIGDIHESPDTPCNSTNTITKQVEPPSKPALGKRMSLPTSSIDLPPHKLLEIKKSIQLDHHLARGQEAHDITHPFGPLMACEPIQNLHPYSNGNTPSMSLQRQAHYNNNQTRKLSLKQSSSLHQQFQQMHIGQTMCMGRGVKHPPVTRQPSYKMAQQQTVMPSVFNGGEMIPALPLEHTPENSSFLLQVANTCAITSSSTVAACNSLYMQALSTGNHFPPHTTANNAANTASAAAAASGYNILDGSSQYMY